MEWLQLIPAIIDTFVGAATLVLGALVYRRSVGKDNNGKAKNDAKINEPVDGEDEIG